MANRIPFSEKLIQKVGSPLATKGFHLVQRYDNGVEVVRYARQFRTYSKLQYITIHGDEDLQVENSIHISVGSHLQGAFLSTLKELMPNYISIPSSEKGVWKYTTEVELDNCLNEISEVIQNYLFDWLENPVFNPSGIKSPLSPD